MEAILVPLDFSEVSGAVIERAKELASGLSAKLWLIYVASPDPDFVGYDPGPQTVRDQVAAEHRDHHRSIQQTAEKLRREGIDATALCPQGATVATILQEAEKLSVDLIVMGSHGHGALYRTLLGSVSEGVMHKADCPVMIVPQRSLE